MAAPYRPRKARRKTGREKAIADAQAMLKQHAEAISPYKPGRAPGENKTADTKRDIQAEMQATARSLTPRTPQGENARVATPKRRKATPIVTEHTRGQANVIDARQAPVPLQGRTGPVQAPTAVDRGATAATKFALDTRQGLLDAFLANARATQDLQRGRINTESTRQAGLVNAALAKALYEQGKHDVQHPTSPLALFDFATLALAAPGAVGRGVMAARAVTAAEDVSRARAAARALATRPPADVLTPKRLLPEGAPAGTRRVYYRPPGAEGTYEQFRLSPNPGVALVQHAVDRLISERFPDLGHEGRLVPNLGARKRIKRQAPKSVRIARERIAALAVPFGEATRKIATGSPQDVALGRIIAYDPDSVEHALELLDSEIALYRTRAAAETAPLVKRGQLATADALEAARPFVANPDAVLKNAVEEGIDLSNLTGRMRVEGGHMSAETEAASRNTRARKAKGARYVSASDARDSAAILRGYDRELVGHEKRLKREIKQATKVQTADEERAAAHAAEANAAAEEGSRERARTAAAVAAAERRVARAEEALYGSQFRYSAEGKKVGQVVSRTAELTAARKELATAKQAQRVARRSAPQNVRAQELTAANIRKSAAAGQAQRQQELNNLGRDLRRISEERRRVQGKLRAVAEGKETIVGAEDVLAGERAAFLASIPRQGTVREAIGGGIPFGRKRKLVHQDRGVLHAQGREELSAKKIIHSRFLATAKRFIEDKFAREKLDKFSVPVDENVGLLPGHRFYNPEGYKIARILRELPPDAILEASTPQELRQAIQDLHAQDTFVHDTVFPSPAVVEKMTADEKRGLRQIDETIAKGYAPKPAITPDYAETARAILDATNSATRLALIYLNPSYLARNFTGNLAFLALHQGFYGIANLKAATRALGELDGQTLGRIDHEIGPGGARGLYEATPGPSATGLLKLGSDRLTELQNRLADQGPRRAAWLHEAQVRGYRTPEQINDLLTNPALEETLNQVSLDARRAMVDFGDLTRAERAIVSRAIFIYPWLKGATRFGKDLVIDRPVSAAIAAHVLDQETKLQNRRFGGPVDPLLGNDVVPIGAPRQAFGTTVVPTVNLQSISPVGQALDVARAAKAFAAGGGTKRDLLAQFEQPLLAAAIDAAHHTNFQDAGASGAGIFLHDLVGDPKHPVFPLGSQIREILSHDQGPVTGAPSTQRDYIRQGALGHGILGGVLRAGATLGLGSARPRLLNAPAARTRAPATSQKARTERQWKTKLDYIMAAGDPETKRAFRVARPEIDKAVRAQALRAAERKKGDGTPYGNLDADLRVLVRLRAISAADRAAILRDARTMSEYDLTNTLVPSLQLAESFDPYGLLNGKGSVTDEYDRLRGARKAVQ